MSSFKDLVKQVNEGKYKTVSATGQKQSSNEKEEEKKSSFRDLVKQVNDGSFNVSSKLKGSDVSTWYSKVSDIGKRSSSYLSGDGYKKADTSLADEIETYLSQAADVGQFIRANKSNFSNYDDTISTYYQAVNYLRDLKSGVKSSNEYYSQWKSEEDYNSYVAQQKDYEAKKSFDVSAGEKEITELKKKRSELANATTSRQPASSYLIGSPVNATSPYAASQSSGTYNKELADLDALISQKSAYLNQAKRIQEGIALAGVVESADFDDYKGYSSTKSDSAWGRLTSDYGMGYDDLTYEYINNKNGIRNEIKQKARSYSSDSPFDDGESIFEQKGYDHLNHSEISIYNYYYAKEGKEAAEKYLDSIQETLNQRKATSMYGHLEDNTALELAFGVAAGLDQFESGMKGAWKAVIGDDSYTPQSATQMASGMVREDLADVGYKLPDWLGGASFGQVGYDTITTTSNMAPSILTSLAIGMVNPAAGSAWATAGQWAGNALLGASAAGGAYQEALNEGFSKDQARGYAILVGGSEIVMEKVLGGISALGGNALGKYFTKNISNADNALKMIAKRLGGSMISEFTEEYLQEVLTPVFQNIALGKNEDVNFFSAEALYAGILGALTAGVMEGPTAIAGEVKTYNTGKQLKAADISAQRLAEIGNLFSADTVANQLAGKVDENTGAYTMGRLFNEIGATLTEQNVNDLTQALVENGMTEDMANKNAEVMAYIIEGGEVSNFQMRMIEKNEILSKVMKEVIIDPNSTLNQRNKGYNDALMALAQEKTGSDAPQTDTAEPAQENAPAADKVDAPEEIVSEAAPAASDDALMAVAESVAQDQQNKSGTVGSAMFTNENQSIVAEHYSNLEATTDNPVIANMDVASRNKLTAAYDPASGMIPKAYVVGSNEAFYYGFEGIPMTTMSKTSIAMALSPEQRAYAYNLGVEAAQRGVEAQSAAMGAAYAKAQEVLAGQGITTKNGTVIVKKKGAGGKAILETSIKESSMTRQQKASYKLADAVAKAVGTDIHVYAGMTEYGKYDEETGEIWLNVNANISGQSMMAFTLGHELVHMAKQWSPKKFKAFADFLLAEYGKKGVAIDALIQEQIDNAQRNGIYLDPHAAYEEVIADACQRMLLDSDAVKKMAAFKEQNPDTWNRIKQAIEKFINKIRAYFKGAEPDSQEAQLYKELDDAAKKILENMFVDMVMDAGEHLSTIRNAFGKGTVVEANENGEFTLAKSKDGSKFLYNDYTWERGGRDTLAAALKAEGFSQEDIDAALTIMDGKHKLVKELGKKFPEQNRINEATITTDLKDGHSVLSALVSNGDYPVNIDLLMVCKKRKAYQRVINRLCETGLIQQATVDALAIAEINKILGKYGFETACLGCFVESRRLRIQEWAQTICKEWNAEVKKRNPNAKAFGFGKGEATLTQDEVMQLIGQLEAGGKKNDQGNLNLGQGSAVKRMGVLLDRVPALRKTLSIEDLITPDGLSRLRRFDSNLFSMVKSRYGSNSPKFVQEFNPYNHELAMYGAVPSEYSSLREYLYAIGGARMQSFSDFIVENWFDYCQIVADLAARKLPMHTYTKEIALVKLLGMTGIKINMSLIPDIDRSLSKDFAGLTRNADGELELIWSDKDRFKATGGKSYMQSINFNDAMALQNDPRYSANVGTIAIGVSDIQIRMMLNDPRIRMVIPYHSSGMNPIFADLMGTSYYKDYTLFQNTTVKQLYNSKGQKVSLKLDKAQIGKLTSGFQFNEVLQELGDARAAADAYKEWCADASKHTITIKGETYTAELTPKFDDFSSEKNYYKLLEDFNTYDCISEQAAPQGDVQQIYPEDFNKILEDELKSQEKHRQKQVANQAFDKAMAEIESYLRTHTKADTVFYAEQHGVSISAKDKKLNAEDKKKLAELRKGVKNSLPNVSERNGRTDAVKYSMPKSNSPYSYDRLISKPDMPITTVDGNVPNNRADVAVEAKKNAAKVGRFDPKTGSVSVRVDDIDTDVILSTKGLRHGLRRTRDPLNVPNYIVTVKAGEILKNSIRINEITPDDDNAKSSYVLIGAARDANGTYVVRFVVNHFDNSVVAMDVLYAVNAKKELAATKSPRLTAEPLSVTSSTISIAKLLDLVNQHFPDILPEEVLKHYGYDASDIGENMLYKSHNTNSMSSRQLLADAFDELVQTPKERQLMDQYRANISKVEEVQDRLKNVRGKIRELSKGNGNKANIESLNKTAADLAKLIDNYDRKLLEMEASKPLRDVLARAKSDAYQKAKQRGEENLKKYQDKVSERFDRGVENRNKTAMKHKIQNVVKELNDLLLNESKKRHVPDSLKKAVASALSMVNMDTVGAEERAAKYAALIAKEEAKANPDQDKIDAYTVTMENIIRNGEKMGQRLKELRDAYEEIQESDDPDIANAYDPVIAGCLKELSQSIGDTPLRNMTIEQLSDVYDMYRMVLTRVRDANKTLLDNIKESISNLASRVIGEVRMTGGEHKYRAAALDPVRKFMWNNLKPVYAMEHIGSATLSKVFDNVRAGEDTWAKDVTEAREYYLEKSKKYGYDSWDFDKKYRFQSASDLEFELTLEQVLSLYAYSKREQAHDHLRLGGFVFDSNIETYKDGKLIKYKVNTADAHQITPEILAEIIGTLTDKQKGFVDEMQDYLSTVMGAKGNEVTMKMYGVKLFKEKFYFPLKSAKQFMFEQNEVSGEVKIKNSGFTNKVVAKANNPVILSNFMEVWSGHVNDMSMYHAFVLPLEDFNRVFNYNSPKRENQPSVSVKGTIQSAYSPAAVHYVKNLITDLNGGARSDSTAGVINKMMGLFKKGAVFASLSVVVQQPSAIARAAALVDMKYFIGPKVDRKRHSLLWDEVKRYAPVAIIKEMGYFDTNMGKSTQDFITGKEYSSVSEKMKALVTDSDYRDEVLSKAPALADEMAWCAIWDAVKRETKAKNPGMDVKSEVFLKMAGERFTEVITKTQVYDSVLSRSANMRSKDTGMKMATSFMAEPTTSINMIADALLQGKRGNRKYCRSAIGAVIASNILNSILVSFVYAGRDDDEDETYVEKYIGTLTAEILDGMNPATYIPFIKDIVSIVQGYDVERSDMAVVSDLWNAYQKLGSSKLSTYRKVEGFAGSIAQIFGLPVKNIMRDVRGIYQTVMSFVNGQQTTKAGIGYAVKSALPGWMGGGDVSNQEQLYEAYLSGDDAHAARVETRYKDESAINSAMSSAIKDHYTAGDIDSETAKDLLVTYAGKDEKDAYWKAEKWEYESETGEDFSKYNEFFAAVETGKNLKTVIKQYTDNGVKESTLKSQLSEHFKPLYIEMPNSERAGIKGYLLNAMTILGDTREDAEEKLAKWQYEADYPELADRITYTQYKRWQTDGKPNGVSLELYTDVAEFRDDGTSSSAKSQEEVAEYINSLPISTAQKDALWCCFWKESTMKKAPWH